MCFGPLVRHGNSVTNLRCCFFFFLPMNGSFCRFRVCGCFLCFYQIFIYFLFKVLSGLTAIAFLLTPSPSQCKQKSRFATPGRYRRTIEIVRTINTSEIDSRCAERRSNFARHFVLSDKRPRSTIRLSRNRFIGSMKSRVVHEFP